MLISLEQILKEVKMPNLRKCERFINGDECYFHTWTQIGAVKTHPEDPTKDHCYSKTMAIIEVIESGEVIIAHPEDLTFIKEGGQDA